MYVNIYRDNPHEIMHLHAYLLIYTCISTCISTYICMDMYI